MKKIVNVNKKTSNPSSNEKILIYGFDKLGFELPLTDHTSNQNVYKFKGCSSQVELLDFDYIIICSGAFEKFIEKRETFDFYWDCESDEEGISAFERMIRNCLKKNKKIIFLMNEFERYLKGQNLSHTDLAKKWLLNFFPYSKKISNQSFLTHKRNEFQTYVENYGVGKIQIVEDNNDPDLEFTRLITDNHDNIFGVELNKDLFFLPFQTTAKDPESLIKMAILVHKAVSDYVANYELNLPEWVLEFNFKSEKNLNEEIENLEKQLLNRRNALEKNNSYKSILANQGDTLANMVVNILKNYFDFDVRDYNEKLEDFEIIDENGEVIVSGEVKGVAKSCARKHISQLITNRDVREHNFEKVKGMFIINDWRTKKKIEDKVATEIPHDCINVAQNNNVVIMRTIDLLNYMKSVEGLSKEERGEKFIKLVMNSTGHLKF